MTQNHKKKSLKQNTYFGKQSRLIAVGASAGGLEALKDFFQNIPEGDNNTYVVIQHLSPDYKSMMGELLAKSTTLSIEQISDNKEIQPGKIYLIPPVNNLVIQNGMLHLLEKPKNQKLNLPIDMFLESMADYNKEQAIAVILSGTGSDGTRGIRAIKEQGGMVMVQDPEQAKFDGMPKSAIQTGLVDYVLPVEDMGGELENFISAPVILHFTEDEIDFDEHTLSKILHLVDKETGYDFREYKHSTLARRVARRVNVCKCNSLEEYYQLLESNPEETSILYREFLIGVTKFFRDSEVWEILKNEVIPELIKNTKAEELLKIWDIACSTGEEAYSLAMLINEEVERQDKKLEVKIFATDISSKHLEVGSLGIYSESIVADVPSTLLQKYFISTNSGYQVAEKVRRMVIFSNHNVLKNPPFSNMDLVMCRNLLIYFQPSIQQKALNVLHYGLKEEGYLVLGTSESVQTHRDSFRDVNRKWKIYQNSSPQKQLKTEKLHSSTSRLLENRPTTSLKRIKTPPGPNSKQKFKTELSETILEQFGGASVFVDSQLNILQAIGEFRKFASLPVSGFSINLGDMLETNLKHVVQSSVKKAQKENVQTYYKDAVYRHNGEIKGLDLIVKPFKQPNLDNEINFSLTFIEKEFVTKNLHEVEKVTLTSRTKQYIGELEDELKKVKEELQTSIEEIETSNEELQAANEELLASNEELQSTNEELQSVNEEINTVNAENVQKMDDLAELNADINNLLESTDIGTIFLDSSLRIRKFTPAIKKHFSLISSDIGRPIDNFTTSFGSVKGKNLVERCKRVINTGKTLERDIVSKGGRSYLQRISPFISSNSTTEGVVITFVDIESLQKAKNKLIASERRFKSFYEEDPVMHLSVDPNTSLIVHCNRKAIEKLEYNSIDDLVGKTIFDLYEGEFQLKAVKLNRMGLQKGELNNIEQEMVTRTGKKLPVILNSTVELDEDGNVITNRFTCVDISELKLAQEELKKQKADLERANNDLEQFVSICSHDLQEPLSTIKFGSDILGKIYSDRLDEKGREYIRYIDEASDRLSAQIRALLEHSKIGRNTTKTMVNTKELLEVVKYDLGKRIRDTNAKIHVGALPKIQAYEVELRLLFQNLLSNSLKYTAKDKDPEIRVSAYPEGNYWIFTIMDNGIGMNEEDQKNIFTIFNRIPTEEKYEGTGVGLAHAHKIVTLHEGSIWVDSQVGVGSTFYIKIKTS